MPGTCKWTMFLSYRGIGNFSCQDTIEVSRELGGNRRKITSEIVILTQSVRYII